MSVITCYNRVRQVPTDSGMCLVEVLSMYGQSVAYSCAIPFDYVKNWVTMDAVDVETTADRIVEVYHYGNGYVSCSDRTREYIGTFVAGIPSEQCVPTIGVYSAQIGSLNVWCGPTETTRENTRKGDSGEEVDEWSKGDATDIKVIDWDYSDENEKKISTSNETETDSEATPQGDNGSDQ